MGVEVVICVGGSVCSGYESGRVRCVGESVCVCVSLVVWLVCVRASESNAGLRLYVVWSWNLCMVGCVCVCGSVYV